MEKTEGKYLYCVIREPDKFTLELCGVGGGKIHCVASGKLAAVVSDAQIMDYPITRENTITHQRVIEEVMQAHSPVLPVSFGTVAKSSALIQNKMLKEKHDKLSDALKEVEGKVELNLKALWLNMPAIFQKIATENPEISRVKKAFAGKTIGIDAAIEIGKLIEAGISARRERIRGEILETLEDLVVDSKDLQLLGDQMIFNIALLIPEKKQKKFDGIVRDLDEQYKDENAYFKYIGPTPPFNFVKVPISLT